MLLRRTAVVVACVAAMLALQPAAFAENPGGDDPASGAEVVAPVMSITYFTITGGTRVCFDGTAAAAGAWSFSITGARTNVVQPQVTGGGGSAPSTTFHACPNVYEDADTGFAFVHFEYQGGSNATATVRPGALFGLIGWAPAGDNVYVSTTGG